jgi:hypothetical protein
MKTCTPRDFRYRWVYHNLSLSRESPQDAIEEYPQSGHLLQVVRVRLLATNRNVPILKPLEMSPWVR